MQNAGNAVLNVPLKLIALDADDLAVISAHVQEARVEVADIIWRQDEKRLVIGMNRLDWEQTLAGESDAAPPGRSTALRPGAGLQSRIRPRAAEAALELVGIEFHPDSEPGGSALLMFSHGGALRLDLRMPGMRTDRPRPGRSGDGAG